jgi:DNA invertase Pin-like site-specific DNA recombinase
MLLNARPSWWCFLHIDLAARLTTVRLFLTWADTTTPHGRLMLTVLGGLAEFERELIRARTSAREALARRKGRR